MVNVKKPAPEPALLLVDNGSLRADATLALRRTAGNLTERLGRLVSPVSVLHSSKVPPEQLDSIPAETFLPALRRRLNAGQRHFRVLPYFIGPSRALTEYLPERIEKLRQENPDWADFEVEFAPPLFAPSENDDRIARALAERVDREIARRQLKQPGVILVDHGSPEPKVTEARNAIGDQLRKQLGQRCRSLTVASMERRDGPEYDFNEPLLERALREVDISSPVVVALLFLGPGRHAGEGGDIAQICTGAEHGLPGLRCFRTDTLGGHPLIEEILAERSRQ
ncbi:sirohydrochlorin chelatase [Cerasicoccus fimbriatus]|uniref:sirohydrochlorin chelatase n=1 Tax=Cerasicoccus fimbriatus TaxID=3014554 RepID=UPI0022B3CFD7|nr:CbiX/SirB N-terminal domain-containing protein [Cerasicoccus sp. TK19100]